MLNRTFVLFYPASGRNSVTSTTISSNSFLKISISSRFGNTSFIYSSISGTPCKAPFCQCHQGTRQREPESSPVIHCIQGARKNRSHLWPGGSAERPDTGRTFQRTAGLNQTAGWGVLCMDPWNIGWPESSAEGRNRQRIKLLSESGEISQSISHGWRSTDWRFSQWTGPEKFYNRTQELGNDKYSTGSTGKRHYLQPYRNCPCERSKCLSLCETSIDRAAPTHLCKWKDRRIKTGTAHAVVKDTSSWLLQ